jgi:propionyl-CoA carboxylase alpha chain
VLSIRYIRRLLIANRGEIARRIIRSAASMGIHTICVYADGDRDEPFVSEADEAWSLNGSSAAESYLDMDKLLRAAKDSGADAVHPGYGFLSENAVFARAVIEAGLIWVGPHPQAIADMGDKLVAKSLMRAINVPVLHSEGLDESSDPLAALDKVGLPALLKAAAGGGGKGMRIIRERSQLKEALAGARREAAGAFGDATVFLEKYVAGARHVEIQVIGDKHGNLAHCFERECSIQRRHQKIIEEAPSSALDAALREKMTASALTAVKSIGYDSAGTVEFLLDENGEFFFLEINTRLQVEHPVTEAVTGIDLVREQLRIAQGERLSFKQEDLYLNGHAIEARLYAEDPQNDFLPVSGELLTWVLPSKPQARFDSGVEQGSKVGVEFDPMLAKVIVHAPSRAEAAHRLSLVLQRIRIQGIVTNRNFLVEVLRHPRFLAGDTTTAFISEVNPSRRLPSDSRETRLAVIAATLYAQHIKREQTPVLGGVREGFRVGRLPPQRLKFNYESQEILCEYGSRRDGSFKFDLLGESSSVALLQVCDSELKYSVDGRQRHVWVSAHGVSYCVHGPFGDVALTLIPRFNQQHEVRSVAGGLVAPMPGRVISVKVGIGDQVAVGQLLAIMEAMKMEHNILAPHAGRVSEIRVTTGSHVGSGDLLVIIEQRT